MLARRSKYNDTDSDANNTDSVPSTQQSPHTPSKEKHMGNPCKHDWLLAKARHSKGAKLMYKKSESPTKAMEATTATKLPPSPKMQPSFGMTGHRTVQL